MSRGTVSGLEHIKIESRSRETRSIKTDLVVRAQAKLIRATKLKECDAIKMTAVCSRKHLAFVLSVSLSTRL